MIDRCWAEQRISTKSEYNWNEIKLLPPIEIQSNWTATGNQQNTPIDERRRGRAEWQLVSNGPAEIWWHNGSRSTEKDWTDLWTTDWRNCVINTAEIYSIWRQTAYPMWWRRMYRLHTSVVVYSWATEMSWWSNGIGLNEIVEEMNRDLWPIISGIWHNKMIQWRNVNNWWSYSSTGYS